MSYDTAVRAQKLARVIQDEYLGGRNDGTVIAVPVWIAKPSDDLNTQLEHVTKVGSEFGN
jgi:hypothetical protein